MAFATTSDVQTRIGRTLTTAETNQASQLLTAATSIIAQAGGKDDDWVDDLETTPQILKTVCIEMVARVVDNPANLDSFRETIGSYSYSKDFRAGYLMPTPPERDLIRQVIGTPSTTGVRLDSVLTDVFPLEASEIKWIE
jgi:hypothetical protein